MREQYQQRANKVSLFVRRFNIVLIILLAYAYFKVAAAYFPLVSNELISSAAVAQFSPAILIGLFWKGSTGEGAIAGKTAAGETSRLGDTTTLLDPGTVEDIIKGTRVKEV